MGYTKVGEWRVEDNWNVVAGKRLIASAGGYYDGTHTTHEENIANANLISAAPDMACALEDIITDFEYNERITQSSINKAVKSLQKAEGKL